MRALAWLLLIVALGCGSSAEPERPAEAPRLRAPAPTEVAQAPAPTPAPRLTEPVTIEARVSTPPHEVPNGAPHAVVHLPAGLDPSRPIEIVVFLHGWSGCARVLALSGRVACADGRARQPGWGLAREHDAARTNSVLVIPQLAFMDRNGRPGRFGEAGAFRTFLEELLHGEAASHLGGTRSVDDFALTLVAHSAGYETALAVLEHGAVDVRSVVLLDALYANADRFAAWARADDERKLVSLHTGRGSTYRESRILAGLVDRAIVEPSPHPHGAIPRRQLAEMLQRIETPSR